MTTVDTVVIGAGHAGLAVSRLLTDAGHDHVVLERGRVGERWRRQSWDSLHLLTPSWMTRLPGWSYEGPDPDGYLAARRVRRPPAGLRRLVRRARGRRHDGGAGPVLGSRRRSLCRRDGPRRPGTPTTSSSRPDRTARRTCRPACAGPGAHLQRVPQPLPAARRRRPGRGRLVLGRAARRRAQPGRPRGGPVGRTAHPDAAPLPRSRHATGGWSPPGVSPAPSTRCPTRWLHDANRRCSSSVATTRPGGARPRPRRSCSRAECGWPAGCRPCTGARSEFGDELPMNLAGADATMHRFLDRVDALRGTRGSLRRGVAGIRPAPVNLTPAPPRLDLRAEGIGTILLATGFRPHHPGCGCRSRPATVASVSTGAGRRRPGVYTVGQRFQHRRDSGMIDGARHDAAHGRCPAARPFGPFALEPWRLDDEPRRRRRRRPGRRRLDGAAARARRRPRRGRRARPSRRRHRVHPRTDAGRGAPAVPVGPARPRGRGRHTPDLAHRLPLLRRRAGAGLDPAEPRRRRAVRTAAHRPRPDPRRRSRGGGRRRPATRRR